MHPPQLCTARLTDKVAYNAKYIHYYFEFVKPPAVPFTAGQYVSLKVSEYGDRRSYSICNSPAVDHSFELLADISPQGLGSVFLEKLQRGQEVSVLSPLGLFVMPSDQEESALQYVATGSGIAPFRSMLFDQLQVKKDTRPITLYWGLRSVENLFWQDEFQELSQSFPNFKFHPVISKPIDDWPLCRGRVTDCLLVHDLPENAGFYLCGNAAMITDVLVFLSNKGVKPDRIHHEKFY